VHHADNPATFRNLNLLDPTGPVKTYTGIALPLLYYLDQNKEVYFIFDQGKEICFHNAAYIDSYPNS